MVCVGFVEYLKLLFFGKKEPVKTELGSLQAAPAAEQAEKPVKMSPEEFEEFLRKGGNMDYTISKVENMEERIKAISEHPIQKKVIEHEILSGMLETMKEMNAKLSYLPEVSGRVNSLPTLNEIYAVMEKMSPGAPDSVRKDIEKIVGKVESELDEAYLLLLKGKGEMTADTVATEFKISRNTASERLNVLCDLGKIKKTRRNRKVFFSLTSECVV
ncbi:MAG: winged helix-turn-helix transcriptional regulator [Candidatus Aenigmarchaeota archaeon]|nr:winged helix-turn-helix transcriptional regulator [Candidatus Aenigmarchaeota archaeon]